MRKSFFGQRPFRGKAQGGKRGDHSGSRGPRGASKGGHEPRDGRGEASGTRFRARPAAGGGARDERFERKDARGGGGAASRDTGSRDTGSKDFGSKFRFQKRGPHSGARDERKGGGRERGDARGSSGTRFRDRLSGGARGGHTSRESPGGHASPSRMRFLKRVAQNGARNEQPGGREAREERNARSAPRFRDRPAPGGPRSDRMERGERREPFSAGRVRPRSSGGKHQQPKVPSVKKVASVNEPMRIAKAMARAGLCSRREAERWIADGRVSINGKVLKTPGVEVKPKDRVLVDGQPLPAAEPSQLWRYNKPKGLVTTHDDPQGRPTVFDNLPPGLPGVISVGRLDFNTEGLILLTNDGELARHLELPATGWLRRYRVRAKGRVTQADLDGLKNGVEIEGVHYGGVEGTIDTVQGANIWLTIGIREGKNREVRKVLGHLGLEVNRLIRISFGPFQLMDLEPGEAESIKRRVLADQLGPQLAAEFGLVDPPEEKSGKTGGGKRRPNKPKSGHEDA